MKLVSMRTLSLEECLEFIDDDELLEITPKNLRMRKRVLEVEMRKKLAARARRDREGSRCSTRRSRSGCFSRPDWRD